MDTRSTIRARFEPPPGFTRTIAAKGTLGDHLCGLRLRPPGTPVHLFNGDLKVNQDAHAAIIEMSVGTRDLQQCADAVMRLRAEYLFANGRQDEVAFDFTNGFSAEWKRWKNGERIKVNGNKCSWSHSAPVDSTHEQFITYLTLVFTYAGTLSLERELVRSSGSLGIGDVFIHGGSPGHAVIVVDKAKDAADRTIFLLAQSYMPAQEIHVLKNLEDPEWGAWYMYEGADMLYTPEWTFPWDDRRTWP